MAEFIVAIELGSSVFRGIAGKKNLDGSITVQALVKEDATQCIRAREWSTISTRPLPA